MNGPKLASIKASVLAILAIRVYAVGMLLYGITIIVQGPERWSGPAYSTTTVIAKSWQWGTVMTALGAFIALGHFTYRMWLRNVGLYGGGVWLIFFAITIDAQARINPNVSYAGSILYGMLAVHMFILARAKEVHPDDRYPKVL